MSPRRQIPWPGGAPPFRAFLGLSLYAGTTGQFLDGLLNATQSKDKSWTLSYLNAATVNLAYEDPAQAARLAAIDLLYADGQAVVWAARWLDAPIAERVNAGDFTRELMQRLAVAGVRVALIGGQPAAAGAQAEGGKASEADRAAECFRGWAPGLRIVLTHHGYFGEAGESAVREAIEAADPDLVLLGMGAPRQEAWALRWAAATGRPRVWWCVGALFEYYAGTRARAPRWMRHAGLEWLFRLALEPGRLARRYLVGNPLFVWRVLRRRPPRGIECGR